MIQKILGKIFQEFADRCEAGACLLTEDELNTTIDILLKINLQDLNIHEVAKELSVDLRTILNWVRRGWLPEGEKKPGKRKTWNKKIIELYKLSLK